MISSYLFKYLIWQHPELPLYSDEIHGEKLFVLYKLSVLNATPWDDMRDNGDVDLSAIGRSLLQLSLEVLLKTQNDAVCLNYVGQYVSSSINIDNVI
jgi:hypothetical protein